jgi:HNH endonuclease
VAKSNISLAIQELVRKRAKECCEYCLVPANFSPDTFPFDHIIPLSLGGSSVPDNLALADGGCNGHKYNKTHHFDPLTNRLSRLFNPRLDKWEAHFQWSEDETVIVGTTPIGRATVELLQVNRESNVNLRRLLILVGLHPPKG